MEKEAEKIFYELKEDVLTYIQLKYNFLKLDATERIAKLIAILSHGVILILLVFFTILFLFFALGFFLGDCLDSTALGFLVVGGIYLGLVAVFLWGKQKIQDKFINIMITALRADDDDDDNDKN